MKLSKLFQNIMHHNKAPYLSDESLNSFKRPLVSILIPSFNHEKYVLDCLESVKCSDYENLELLLLDDGSSDNTFKIAEKWFLANSARFVNASCSQQRNSGICKTLNELVLASSGEYFSVLASDDQLLPRGIAQQLVCALDSHAELILSDCELIDENDSLIASSAFEYFGKNATRLKNRTLLHLDILLNWNLPYPHQFIKRTLFDSLGPYNTNYLIEDFDFCLKALFSSNLDLCQHRVWRYRVRLSDRVTPGLREDIILQNVRTILQSHLHQAKGLENLVLKAALNKDQNNDKLIDIRAVIASLFFKMMRVFLKIIYKVT